MNDKLSYYNKILALKEAKEFARILKKWEKLSENMHSVQNVPMVLPDLLWVAKSGVGKTNLLRLLSEYLYEKGNLMEFYGNVKYFEFMLDYCPPENPFTEIERLITEVRNAAGFRSVYKGIISFDIEEWLDHCEEKHFLSFLEYLSSNSDSWLIVFNVTGEKTQEIKKLESILSMFFRIEKSNLTLPDSKELLRFVSDRLESYGLTLEDSALELIQKTVERLRQNKYFDGYKTLIILCQDIIYEIFSSGHSVGAKSVTAELLAGFAPDSEYIARVTWKTESKRKIGLLG